MEKSLYQVIEEEYKKVDKKWMFLHFKSSIGLALLTFILECGIGYILLTSGFVNTTLTHYLMKFLIIPSLINVLLVFIQFKILFSNKISLEIKIYTVSLLLVLICFVVYTVHSSFSSLYFIFVAPIVLTAIYVKYKLTVYTSILSILSFIVSELFIDWDFDKVSALENGATFSNFLIAIFTILSFIAISLVIIYFEKAKYKAGFNKEIERHNLKQKVLIDELTQTFNRVALRNSINQMYEDKTNNNYTFVMIDIDHFKELNDCFGHVEGDYCLMELCCIMKKNCGDAKIFRYGGDEFSFLFKNLTQNKILKICENIQKDFKSISKKYKTKHPVTLSFGIADYIKGTAPSELIINSDKALYESKKIKNKITIFK